MLANVLALAESYPELKADAQFRDLSYEIAGSQNRIALERQRYNEIVGLLNARLRQIPWSLVADGFESAAFYEAPREQLGRSGARALTRRHGCSRSCCCWGSPGSAPGT